MNTYPISNLIMNNAISSLLNKADTLANEPKLNGIFERADYNDAYNYRYCGARAELNRENTQTFLTTHFSDRKNIEVYAPSNKITDAHKNFINLIFGRFYYQNEGTYRLLENKDMVNHMIVYLNGFLEQFNKLEQSNVDEFCQQYSTLIEAPATRAINKYLSISEDDTDFNTENIPQLIEITNKLRVKTLRTIQSFNDVKLIWKYDSFLTTKHKSAIVMCLISHLTSEFFINIHIIVPVFCFSITILASITLCILNMTR